jgi:hypothetical protein
VATLAKALPMLLDVLLLCLFAFFVFGIVAVQLFAGALRNRYVRSHALPVSRAASSRRCVVTPFGSRVSGCMCLSADLLQCTRLMNFFGRMQVCSCGLHLRIARTRRGGRAAVVR